ncbi:archaetidylserine decarboxylase [Ramlibacter montanisoli]|uniref:archaetidylserine decarboxylase n=1 Tax=Ramlibacter montanisoli TaxID=2732512 RepID=UPI0035A1ADAA
MPKKLLTILMGKVASMQLGSFTHAMVRRFVKHYKVDMGEAADPRIESYASFNDFFTRPLREGARPPWPPRPSSARWTRRSASSARSSATSCSRPRATATRRALVGGDQALAHQFDHGHFATLYLAPKDYHRIHMPCEGRLKRMIYIPGDLFSVNPLTARHVPSLFARNERVVCEFECAHGPMVMVLVGATIVGSMATVWHGVVNPPRTRAPREWRYDDQQVVLAKGAEMGRFLLGSTVIMLFPKNVLTFTPDWATTKPVRLGEAMATVIETEAAL